MKLKSRIPYIIAFVACILLGLFVRKTDFSPDILKYGSFGDAIWAMMVYFGFRIIKPNGMLKNCMYFSLVFCYVIELSQLYQAAWINDIRANPIGALILGSGFLWMDIIAYTLGVLLAMGSELLIKRHLI